MIEGAELTVYVNNGENITIDLSPVQLAGIVMLLGIEYNTANSAVTMFSDDTVKLLIQKGLSQFKKI